MVEAGRRPASGLDAGREAAIPRHTGGAFWDNG